MRTHHTLVVRRADPARRTVALLAIGAVAAAAAGCGSAHPTGARAAATPGRPAATSPTALPSGSAAGGDPPFVTLAMPAAQALPAGVKSLAVPGSADAGGDLVVAGGGLWLSGLHRIDPASNTVARPLKAAGYGSLAAGNGALWAADFESDTVARFDPRTGRQLQTVHLRRADAPAGLVLTPGALWVAAHHAGVVERIDPVSGRVVARIKVGDAGVSGPGPLAAGLGSVWTVVPRSSTVVRIDPSTNRVRATVEFPMSMTPCGGLGVTSYGVWTTECLDGTAVARIDPHTNRVVTVMDAGGYATGLWTAGHAVWFVDSGNGEGALAPPYLVELGSDDHVIARYRLPTGFISGAIVSGYGSLWLADSANPRVLRVPLPR